MNFDISKLLEQWDYQVGQILVRQFKGEDGHDKLQLRVDLGLLQMNLRGRPDGRRPFGHESLLEYHSQRLEKHMAANAGSAAGFHLAAEECAKLQQEAIQYHHRYICLFQLKDFEGVMRDAERNLRVFELVSDHAEPEMAFAVQQIAPQLLMMRTRARATMKLDSSDHDGAISCVEDGIEELRDFFREAGRQDVADQSAEVVSLDIWLNELRGTKPVTEREKLEQALSDAVSSEDYEKAAQIRDSLKKLNTTV